jgi:mRNA-degrading endonuclease RelE of RelBE toxin-antitoxin system
MNWDFQLANAAQRALRRMQGTDRTRVNEAFNAMKNDPLSGDIIALKGEYQGLFRSRIGSWRIIFRIKSDEHVILITDIVRRTSTTY